MIPEEASSEAKRRGCGLRILGCLGLGLLVVGGIALFNWHTDRSDIARLRERLPAPLAAGKVIAFDRCDRLFGGASYALALDAEAMDRWRRGASDLPNVGAGEWRGAGELRWGDGPPTGLMCLSSYEFAGKRLSENFSNADGFYRRDGRRADYVIPSLGVVVGGEDPR